MSTAIQVLATGLLLGLIYTLVGLGLTVSLGVLRILNLTHGLLIIGGAMLAEELYRRAGLDPLLTTLLALPLFFLIGAAMHMLLIRRAATVSEASVLLVLFGAMVLFQALSFVAFTSDSRSLTTGYSDAALRWGAVAIRVDYLVAGLGALVLLVAMQLAFRMTMPGRAVQALAQNPEAARVLGVDVGRYTLVVFGISTAIAGAAGSLLASIVPFAVADNSKWLAFAFIVVLVGGTGRVANAVVGGLLLGMSQALFNELLPLQIVPAVIYGLLVVAMIIRGSGLAATKERAL